MNIFHAFVLGIIEGFTEFIPVSSTGHLIVASHILRIPQTPFVTSFEIIIQLGALCAVIPFFIRTILRDRPSLYKIIIAFAPTAIVGFLLYKKIKALFDNPIVVIASLFIGGVLLIVLERYIARRAKKESVLISREISFWESFYLGIFQTLAFIPGVSRSGATIAGGLLLNVERAVLVEFTFLLAVPTIAAASGLDILKSSLTWSLEEIVLLVVGFVTAFICGYISMRWLLRYISHHTFIVFGIYRIVAALVFFYILF